MKLNTKTVAAEFINDLNQVAGTIDDNNQAEAEQYALGLASRLHSRSTESNERLNEATLGFLRGTVGLAELQRTAEEHCFIYGIRSYLAVPPSAAGTLGSAAAPLPAPDGRSAAVRR